MCVLYKKYIQWSDVAFWINMDNFSLLTFCEMWLSRGQNRRSAEIETERGLEPVLHKKYHFCLVNFVLAFTKTAPLHTNLLLGRCFFFFVLFFYTCIWKVTRMQEMKCLMPTFSWRGPQTFHMVPGLRCKARPLCDPWYGKICAPVTLLTIPERWIWHPFVFEGLIFFPTVVQCKYV